MLFDGVFCSETGGGLGRVRRACVTNDEILTIKEAAALLKLTEKTVYSMAQRGEIPAFKIRGQWRIRRLDYDDWIAEQAGANGRGSEGAR